MDLKGAVKMGRSVDRVEMGFISSNDRVCSGLDEAGRKREGPLKLPSLLAWMGYVFSRKLKFQGNSNAAPALHGREGITQRWNLP